jgi:glycosyltransferase involved in cell wall biosynthesis
MKVLFLSNLFPNSREPTRGIFNAQQIAALSRVCAIVKIIAPSSRPLPAETFHEIPVSHPRFLHLPLLSRRMNGWLYARAIETEIRNTPFDIALVNWAYPDAYGVMLLSQRRQFRFVTTVQGSDVNDSFQSPWRKRKVLRALRASAAVCARSDALRERLAAEGIAATTIHNGIDRATFFPADRAAACAKLKLPPDRRRILYVGNLQPVKDPLTLATAFTQLRDLADVDIVFVGNGPEQQKLAPDNRLFLAGARPHHEIADWLNACDALCVPSRNEGLPNVALEAIACGLPVVATQVGGIPEVVRPGENGLLVPPANPPLMAQALRQTLNTAWDKNKIRQSIADFDWSANAKRLHEILTAALEVRVA